MKKRWIAMLAVLGCLCMAACGGGDTSASPTNAPEETKAPEVTKEAEATKAPEVTKEPEATKVPEPTKTLEKEYLNIYAFEMKFNGDTLKFPMWYSELEAKGWKYLENPENELSPDYDYRGIWEKDGIRYNVYMYNPSANTMPVSQCAVAGFSTDVYGLPEDYVQDVELQGNIKFGVSTKEDIIDTFGNPTDTYENEETEKLKYEYGSYEYVYLTLENGVFAKLEIRNKTSIEGMNAEVSYAIPDYVEGYQAPTSDTGEAADLVFAVDEVYYKLPCPISELIEHGFVVLTDYQNRTLASGAYDEVVLRYGNHTVECQVKNFAKYATVLENCFVTEITAEKLELAVLGGIRPGITGAEAEALLSGKEYEKEESIHAAYGMGGNNYTLDSSEGYRYFIMTDKDGIVDCVRIASGRIAPENGTGAATDKMYQRVVAEIPEDSIYSFRMNKDGDKFKLPMQYSEMAAMGWELQEDVTVKLNPGEGLASQTWKKDDFTMQSVLYNPTDETAALSDCLIIELSLDLRSAALFKPYDGIITLPGGIQMFASTKEEVHAAYGTPTEENEVEYLGDTTYYMTYSDGEGGYVKFSIYNYPVEYNGKTYENVLSSVEMRNSKPTVTEMPTKAPTEIPPESLNPLYEFSCRLEDMTLQFPIWYSELYAMGCDYLEEAEEIVAPGEQLLCVWDTFIMYNCTSEPIPAKMCAAVGTILEDTYREGGYFLPGNVEIGIATGEEVLAAYGEPTYEQDGVLTYELESNRYVKLTLEDNVLVKAEICNRIPLPENTKNFGYALEELKSLSFRLNGEEFQVMFPVSDLENAGWEYDGNTSIMVEPDEYGYDDSGSHSWTKDGFSIEVWMYNPTDAAIPIRDCTVVRVAVNEEISVSTSGEFVLPGGIKLFESTERDIRIAYGEPTEDYNDRLRYVFDEENDKGVFFDVDGETGVLTSVVCLNFPWYKNHYSMADSTILK